MNGKNLVKVAGVLLLVLWSTCLTTKAQTPPPLPFWQLSTWSFEDTSWYSDLEYAPLSFTNLNNPPSFDGNAMQVDTNVPAWLQYHIVESDSTTNITFEEGSIEMWVLPDWNSGTGPGNWGRLIDVGTYSTNDLSSWWSLYFSPDGTSLNFSSGTDGDITDYISYPISWDTNTWHFIALTYRFYKTELFIDGQFVTNGPGVWFEPSEQAQTNGFYVGSDATGTKQARGLIDDLATYNYALNATDVTNDYVAMLPLLGIGGGFHTFDDPTLPGGGGGGGSSSNSYIFSGGIPVDTNGLWLEITNVSSEFAFANLHNGTNQVYAIWSTTNLLIPFTNWQVETEVFPTDTNCQPFSFPTLNRQNLFMLAEDWTGVDSDGDGIPDWWTWNYFGVLSLNATNLDSGGVNTLGYDYANSLDPNIIYFTLSATNYYVNQTNVPLQINLTGGTPSYYSVLINDTNTAGAVWQSYAGTNLTVTLGPTDGMYQVSVGLKGLPTNATPTWVATDIPFSLDRVPPTLVITNLPALSGSRPYIDPAGYSTKALNSLTFAVTNSIGCVAQGQGIINRQGCNPADMSHVTNWFQCLDLALTLGTNYVGIQTVDWAGNATNYNFSYVFDTNGDTNPPAITLLWPQDGATISGDTFTLRGTLDDDTATVYGECIDTNGNTNTVSGLVERGGSFWLENVPLYPGTNYVTVFTTDAAGNQAATNLTLVQSSVTLTLDPVDGSQLNQAMVNVTGTISDPTYAIWVNGVEGANNGDGTWSANDVPVTSGGTASFDLTAYPSAYAPTSDSWTNFSSARLVYQNPPPTNAAQASVSEDKQPWVFVSGITMNWGEFMVYTSHSHTDTGANTMSWQQGAGGSQTYTASWWDDTGAGGSVTQHVSWPADPGYTPSLPAHYQYVSAFNNTGIVQNIDTNEVYYPSGLFQWFQHTSVDVVYSDLGGYLVPPTVNSFVQMTISLFTGGKALRNSQSLFMLGEGLTWVGRAGFDAAAFDNYGSVPSTEIALNGLGNEDTNGYVYTAKPDGQIIDITPRANRANDGGGLPAPAKYSITHVCVATTPTNQDRLTIGVCEEVKLGGMPDNTTWTTSAGSILTNSTGIIFMAPDTENPKVEITATAPPFPPATLDFSVIKPSGGTVMPIPYTTNLQKIPYLYAEQKGCWFLPPDNVSFYNISVIEGPTTAIGTGYYASQTGYPHDPGTGNNTRNAVVVRGLGTYCGNVDTISGGAAPPYYTNGVFVWHIPWLYITPRGTTNYFTTVDHTGTLMATATNAATLTVKKGNVVTPVSVP